MNFQRPALSCRLQANGLSVHYLDWPGDDSLPVLLLHPKRGNARHWDFLVEHSGWRGRFVAPDMRGHGLSDWPADGHDVEHYTRDVLAVMDALALPRCVIVGAATGGNLALLLASQHPDRVAGIVVVDAGLEVPPAIAAEVSRQIEHSYEFRSFAEAKAEMHFSELWSPALRDHYAHYSFRPLPGGRWAWAYDQAAARGIGGSINKPIWDRIAVQCPAIMLRGAQSEVFTQAHLDRLKGLIPQARTVSLAGSDHMPAQDNPRAMADLLDGFLAGCQGSDGVPHAADSGL